MKEFVEKLIGGLEEYPTYSFGVSLLNTKEYIKVSDLKEIVNQLAEEYNNDFCEWKGIDMLGLYNSSCQQKSIVNPFWTYCPYCGKKIKVVE